MHESEDRHRIAFERTTESMTLQSKNGEVEQREYEVNAAQNDAVGDRMLIRFSGPADVKDTALLSAEDPKKRDNEQWIYMPAFRKTRRLGTAELGDRFVGSDILFEDLKRRYIDDYDYSVLREEVVDGESCWVIESKPVAARVVEESPYGKTQFWLRKNGLIMIKVRQFDRRMRPLKETVVTELVRVGGTAWRANRIEIVDVVRQHRTVVRVQKRDVGAAPPDSIFSKHAMGRG